MTVAQLTNQYRALIVDPNPLTRSYIWEAVLSDRNFSIVTASRSSDDSAVQFQQGYECDVVLISSHIDVAKIDELISVMKSSEGGKEAAVVSIVYATEQTPSAMGGLLAQGADGLLISPFSVDSLSQVANIAKKVKQNHERKKKTAAANLIARELFARFDEVNRCIQRNADRTKPIQKLKVIVEKLNKILESYPDIFVSAIANASQELEPPKSSYAGASQRIKKKLNS